MKEMKNEIRIAIIAGVRSHYIKTASLQRMIKKHLERLQLKYNSKLFFYYINAGQHYDDCLTQYINELDVRFDYSIQYENKNAIEIMSSMFIKLHNCLFELNKNWPIDYVMVFGDVNSTMVGAIVAEKLHIPLIHIESGVRLFDRTGPEEANRIVADHLSNICFYSSVDDEINLIREGLGDRSFFSGDINCDLVLDVKKECRKRPIKYIFDKETKLFDFEKYIVASMHREENLSHDQLYCMFNALNAQPYPVLFPIHPRVKKIINSLSYDSNKIVIADHIPYYEMINALTYCDFIVTDSGSLQREGCYLGKHCVVRQEKAYWPTFVNIGLNLTVGCSTKDILFGIEWAIENKDKEVNAVDFFGSGHAVERILQHILSISD